MNTHPHLAVIGFGTMGQAICKGLLEAGDCPPERIHASDRHAEALESQALSLGLRLEGAAVAVRKAEVVLLCVKPRELGGLLTELESQEAMSHNPLIISIAAGVNLDFLEARVPEGTAVVRAMPNTPCSVRRGMTVLAPGRLAHKAHLTLARSLFEPLGSVMDLEGKHMDAVTGPSASGPSGLEGLLTVRYSLHDRKHGVSACPGSPGMPLSMQMNA